MAITVAGVGFHEALGAGGAQKLGTSWTSVLSAVTPSAQHLKGSVAQGMGDLGVPRGNNNAHSTGTVGQLCVVQT